MTETAGGTMTAGITGVMTVTVTVTAARLHLRRKIMIVMTGDVWRVTCDV